MITRVGVLTKEQASILEGMQTPKGVLYNVRVDINGNHVISIEEVTSSDIEWVNELPLIKWEPPAEIEEPEQ